MEEYHGLDTKLLERFLKKRFHDEKPTEVISVEVKNAVPKGQNYASLIYSVKMTCLTAAGKKKSFSMIVKSELTADGVKATMKELSVFQSETRVFTTILPMMEELMEEFNDKREKLWADLLGFQPYNKLVFEDLSDNGYIVADRRKGLDFNHSKLVLRNLARMHAMSKVLLARGLITAEDRGQFLMAKEDPFIDKFWDITITMMADAMEHKWGDEWKEMSSKLRKQLGSVGSKMRSIAENVDQRFVVFNHGDVWTCNFMFRYMEYEDSFPISIKFIDYQGCHVNSFIWDVVQFLFSSSIPSVRRLRLTDLLETYHKALEKNLNIFNYAGYVPTLEDVKSEWKRVEYLHFCLASVQPITVAETSTAFDIEKVTTHLPHEVVDETVFTDGRALNDVGEDYKTLAAHGVI
uniref:Ribosomal RNA small subunit methyltransferase G n=3 Tax=Lygus hesperus TaxID=30085 RepID=A0A0A9VW02_LYGHE